jgi:hypothetical protein
MSEPNLNLMRTALEGPVTVSFESNDEARAFRADCYRQRDAFRLVGVRDYDVLKFHLRHNMLTIVARRTHIRGIL